MKIKDPTFSNDDLNIEKETLFSVEVSPQNNIHRGGDEDETRTCSLTITTTFGGLLQR